MNYFITISVSLRDPRLDINQMWDNFESQLNVYLQENYPDDNFQIFGDPTNTLINYWLNRGWAPAPEHMQAIADRFAADWWDNRSNYIKSHFYVVSLTLPPIDEERYNISEMMRLLREEVYSYLDEVREAYGYRGARFTQVIGGASSPDWNCSPDWNYWLNRGWAPAPEHVQIGVNYTVEQWLLHSENWIEWEIEDDEEEYEEDEDEEDEEEYEEEYDNFYIHDYDYKPRPTFHGVPESKEPYFGVELEVEVPTSTARADVAREAIQVQAGLFYAKSDGSLDHGFEIVSHPMSLGYAQASEWDELVAILNKHDARSWDTSTCGLHVHISREHMSLSHLYKLGWFITLAQDELAAFAGRSSRRWAAYARKWAQEDGKIVMGKSDDIDRYMALNLKPKNTVELRIFRGTLNPKGILAAIELAHALYIYTRDLTFAQVQTGALSWKAFRAWVKEQSGYIALEERIQERLGESKAQAA